MARNYRKIDVYHLSYTFVLDIYRCTKDFPKQEEQNITSQIRRAATSIPLNIVEGSAKASNREFIYFLNVAYASAKEVEVLRRICRDLKYFDENTFTFLASELDDINAKLFLFIRNIESRIKSPRYKFFKKFESKSVNLKTNKDLPNS